VTQDYLGTGYGEAFHPLEAYRDKFSPVHQQQVRELFQTMVDEANIDVEHNQLLTWQITQTTAELDARTKLLNKLRWLRVGAIAGAFLAVAAPFIFNGIVEAQNYTLLPIGWVIAGVLAAGLVAFSIRQALKLTSRIQPLRVQNAEDASRRSEYIAEATAGLAPLANTYHWNMLDPIVERTVEGLKLDTYVPISRQDELGIQYGLGQPVGYDSSVTGAQSGTFRGNPFVFLQTINFAMGSKTYRGTLVITWVETETYTDSNGRTRTRPVTRTQTLVAHVTKPFPTYWPDAALFMGTQAVPDLAFTRAPSKLSRLEGKSAERKVNRTVKKLEKRARNTAADNNYTVMANQDFEALFHAIDRNDEVQFRVLFTPAAQQQMVDLLRDKELGPGDNFEFVKNGPIITVRPQHLIAADLIEIPAPPPDSSEHWDLAAQATGFSQRASAQFRTQYFGLAPVLALPLLHEPPSSATPQVVSEPSIWEVEATANHRLMEFAPPDSITTNILKADPLPSDPERFQITAMGFRGIERVDFVPTLGGDGRWHPVPVPWVEYLPVQATRSIDVWDGRDNGPRVGENFRRGLYSTIVS